MHEVLQRLTDVEALVSWLRPLYDGWGYLIVLLGAYAENTIFLGLFFPGGTMVLLGAFYSRLGTLAWPAVLLLATAGTVSGVATDYLLGRLAWDGVLAPTPLGRHASPHISKARDFLARHGAWAVLLGHFAGQTRTALALAAGTSRFGLRRYLALEVPAALAYNLLYCALGYLLAEKLDVVEWLLGRVGATVWVLAALLIVVWLVRRRYARHKVGAAADPRRPPAPIVEAGD